MIVNDMVVAENFQLIYVYCRMSGLGLVSEGAQPTGADDGNRQMVDILPVSVHRCKEDRRCYPLVSHALTGLLFDDAGHPMVPTHATKNRVRYRYYGSQPQLRSPA